MLKHATYPVKEVARKYCQCNDMSGTGKAAHVILWVYYRKKYQCHKELLKNSLGNCFRKLNEAMQLNECMTI